MGKTALSIACLLLIGFLAPADTGAISTLAEFFSALSELLSVGNEFLAAVDEFEKWGDELLGSVKIVVENYFNDTNLMDMAYHMAAGEIDKVTFDVLGGEKQAIAAKGHVFEQTEGLAGWSLPNATMKLVIYWRVPHKKIIPPQKPNKLGIGFVHASNDENWLKNLAEGSKDLAVPSIGIREYASDGTTMQCCSQTICIQGLMTSSHHSEVSIRVVPRKADQLFHQVDGPGESQKFLDQILNSPETCSSSSAAVPKVASAGLAIVLLTITALL